MKERLQVGTETRSTLQILTPFQALDKILLEATIEEVEELKIAAEDWIVKTMLKSLSMNVSVQVLRGKSLSALQWR